MSHPKFAATLNSALYFRTTLLPVVSEHVRLLSATEQGGVHFGVFGRHSRVTAGNSLLHFMTSTPSSLDEEQFHHTDYGLICRKRPYPDLVLAANLRAEPPISRFYFFRHLVSWILKPLFLLVKRRLSSNNMITFRILCRAVTVLVCRVL